MTGWRRGMALALLGSPVAVVLVAGPARADATGTITSPTADAVVRTAATLPVRANVDYPGALNNHGTVRLLLTDPRAAASRADGCEWELASTTSAGPLERPLDLTKPYPSGVSAACTALAGGPAVDGNWKVTLTGDGAADVVVFTVRVPPQPPTGVAATADHQDVTVGWDRGREPDTHAYDVLDDTDAVVAHGDTGRLCSAGACRVVVGYPAGGRHVLRVRALRATCPGCTEDLTATSGGAAVDVPAPPGPPATAPAGDGGAAGAGGSGPAPTASPGGSGPATGSGSGSAASPTGGSRPPAGGVPSAGPHRAPSPAATRPTTAPVPPSRSGPGVPSGTGPLTFGTVADPADRQRLSDLFRSLAAPGGLPTLPLLAGPAAPTGTTPTPGDGEPTADGTFAPSLGYAPQQLSTGRTVVVAGQDRTVALSAVADALGVSPRSLWASVAGSLLLLIAAGHVRRWVRRAVD